MTIDLHRLDSIDDYDAVIEALDDYLEELLDEFLETAEGKAYLAEYPEMDEFVGSWIYHLLYLGYSYESVTLPRMTKVQVEAIVTKLFPRKIILGDPEEAEPAIPELVAFWAFLYRVYKLPQASKVVTLLKQLQPKFKTIMNDASNFGIGKSFIAQGMAAGFDMTTQAGLEAYQQEYNQRKQIDPPNFNSLFAALGIEQVGAIQDLMGNLSGAMPANSSAGASPPDRSILDILRQGMTSSQWQSSPNTSSELSAQMKTLLQQQTITATSPGTILQDFQTLLDFIGDKGTAVSPANHLLPLKSLTEINERLSTPIKLDLKRPVQKSYPPIDGLYLLLRASGLARVSSKGKKYFLSLNPELLTIWNSFNPTERYCTLLETWLVRAHPETIGERGHLNLGSKCFQFWPMIPAKGKKVGSYDEQYNLNFYPELRNIALFQLFGFIQLDAAKPAPGKGWLIKQVKKLPFGDAMMTLLYGAYLSVDMYWPSEENPDLPFAELQPTLQPYFPEWKNVLQLAETEFRSGIYTFKVYLRKCWRRIAIASELTLDDLASSILESVDFDNDHLDMFIYENQFGRSIKVYHPFADNEPKTDTVKIGSLPLNVGTSMEYIFDFGDWWEFKIELEKIQPDATQTNYVGIIERFGDAPEQYPDWDEE
jgi:Plasmid pRiA4b ORF-3-like protein